LKSRKSEREALPSSQANTKFVAQHTYYNFVSSRSQHTLFLAYTSAYSPLPLINRPWTCCFLLFVIEYEIMFGRAWEM